MYLAKHQHEGEAATWRALTERHPSPLQGLVKDADATEFWNLTPTAVKKRHREVPARKDRRRGERKRYQGPI